jgi:hypothetical protein
MTMLRTIAAVFPVFLAAATAHADTIIQQIAKRPPIKHTNAKINGVDGDQIAFTIVGANRKVSLLEVTQIELPASKELTEAEELLVAGQYAKAAPKYENVVVAGRPAWTPAFARIRLMSVYAATGDSEKLARNFVELYRTNPKEAAAFAGGEPIVTADKDKAEKIVRDAMTRSVGKDTVPLREFLGRITGKSDVPVTKTDTPIGPVTKNPGTKETPKAVGKVDPMPAAVEPIVDVAANIKEASAADISEIERMYKAGSFARAADTFIGFELGLSVDPKQAETFYVNGGMACIKAAEKVIADIDKLRVEGDRAVGAAAAKFREDARKLEPLKKRYLTFGAIALIEALRIQGTDPKKMAEPAFWCAWAHEQLDRPLQARSIYDYFVRTFNGHAPEDLFKRGKAGYDRLAQGS